MNKEVKCQLVKRIVCIFFAIFILTTISGCAFLQEQFFGSGVDNYKITYELNEGNWISGYTAPTKYTRETTVILPTADNIVKSGSIFIGWYEKADFSSNIITIILEGSTGDKTLYAKWIVEGTSSTNPVSTNSYTITYKLNGGTWASGYTAPATYTNDKTLTLPTTDNIVKTNYRFVGWYENSNLSGNVIESISIGSDSNKTLYAKWVPTGTYTITYELNGGECSYWRSDSGSYTVDESRTLPESRYLRKDDSRFIGWYETSDFSSSIVTTIPIGSTGDKKFYARWIPSESYAITYERDGGIWVEGYTVPMTFTESQNVLLPTADNITKTDAIFAGWYTTPEFSGSVITSSNSIFDSMMDIYMNYNGTLYAKWVPIATYTITYNLNDGAWADGYTPPATYTNDTTLILPVKENLTKSGNVFASWYLNSTLTGEAITTINIGSMGRKTLYAKWDTYQNITAATVDTLSTSLQSGGSHIVSVTGEIDSSTISIIATAIMENSAVVSLDLSNTTGLTSIGERAFDYCSNLISIILPSSVTSIESYAFTYCSSLKNITIPNSVKEIQHDAFFYCDKLQSITIPDSVIFIGSSAFGYCRSLKNTTISNSLTSIEASTFEDCSSLTNVIIPDSVTSIGAEAFNGCNSLTTIIIPSNVTSISNSAFEDCYNITSLIVDSDNLVFSSSTDGKLLLNKDGTILYQCLSSAEKITIPSSVLYIGNSVFYGCRNLEEITFEDTSTWFYTSNSDYTNGTLCTVTNPSTNRNYFPSFMDSPYYNYYWYKE